MSVRGRLVATYAGVILVLSLPGFYAALQLGRLRQLAVEGRSGQAVAVSSLGRMSTLLADLDRLERSFVVTDDSDLHRAALATVDSLRGAYARFEGTPYAYVAADLGPLIGDLGLLTADVGDHMELSQIDAATAAFERMLSDFDHVGRRIDSVADSIDVLSQRDLGQAEEISRSARIQTLAGILIAVLLTGVLAAVTTHLLTSPLRRLGRAMARVADGAFEEPDDLPYQRRDEIGELSSSFRAMARRLAELDRTKSEFLGMVSHELKTPINVINAYAELIEDGLADETGDSRRELLAKVREQAQAMTRLVSRLMDLSRLGAGTYRIAPEPVRTESLVSDVDKTFSRVAEERDIDFRTRVASTVPETIVVDVDLLRDEVLGNLILNALRFAPPGGWVALEAEGDAGGVAFTVTDSGPGVPEEHRDLIFQKHYVADRTRAVGSGLGLAIAKEMVELHGGLITLEDSAPGCGARFRVALPAGNSGAGPADLETPDEQLMEPALEVAASVEA